MQYVYTFIKLYREDTPINVIASNLPNATKKAVRIANDTEFIEIKRGVCISE